MFKRAHFVAPFVAFAMLVTSAVCQEPADQPKLEPVAWNWKPVSRLHDSIVKVSLGAATGTGVIVSVDEHKPAKGGFEGYCLTALHVVEDDGGKRKIKVTYKNGRRSKNCALIHKDEKNDLALLWVWVPAGVEAAPIAAEAAKPNQLLEFSGLGGGEELKCCLRNFTGYASDPTDDQVIFANVSLLPGDSGGPIFDNGKLVGIISGGWFWFDGGAKSSEGFHIQTTWPTRGANLGAVKNAMAQIELCKECSAPEPALASAEAAVNR